MAVLYLRRRPRLACPCEWPGLPGRAAGNREAPFPEAQPPAGTTNTKLCITPNLKPNCMYLHTEARTCDSSWLFIPMDRKAAVSRPLTLEWRPLHRNKAVFSFCLGSLLHSSRLSTAEKISHRLSLNCNKKNDSTPKAQVTDGKIHRKEVSSSSITSRTSRTDSDGAVRPADDVGVSFVKLSGVLHGDFAVIELLDMPGVHGNRLQLHLTSLLQRDDPVSPLDVDPGQHAVDQAVPFQWLTRHQSLGVAGAQEVWRRGHWEAGLNWDRLSRNGKQMVGREVLSVPQVVV